jgi:SAM-dependent methyltransferase
MTIHSEQDAFGHALMDHRRQGAVPIVIERDDGYVDVDDTRPYFAPYREWPVRQRRALRYARGRILDIGCGAGRHALHLQTRGLSVLGIDSSPLAVKVCRNRGLRSVRCLAVEQLSQIGQTFDTILMLGNNFGLFAGPTKGRRLLSRFLHLTTDKARIIAETLDPYRTSNPCHFRYHHANRARGRMAGQVRIRIRYQIYVGPWFEYLFASREELEAFVKGTGWRVERIFDSGAPIYIAILEKCS